MLNNHTYIGGAMDTSNQPGDSSRSSFDYTDSWVDSFSWVTFGMSFFGLPLTFTWWGWECPPEYMTLLTLSVKITFVGSVYYPLASIARWKQGKYLKPAEWSTVYGSCALAAVFGGWLGSAVYSDGVFILAVIAPAFAGLVTMLRMFATAR
jgi:hypothetical protein